MTKNVSAAQATIGMTGSLRLMVAHILQDENQPRKTFDPDKYAETKASIKAIGLQVPITVNLGPIKDGVQYYYIKYGENRWRIHVDLEIQEIDCVIAPEAYDGKLNVLRVLTQAAENINRIDHTHSEIASVYRLYFDEARQKTPHEPVGKIQEAFARIFGKSLMWVQNYAVMANLRQEFLDRVDTKGPTQIPFMAAVALGRNPKERQTSILHGAEILAGTRRDMLYKCVLNETRKAKRANNEKVRHRASGTKRSLTKTPAKLQSALEYFGAGMNPIDRGIYLRRTIGELSAEELKTMVSELEAVITSTKSLKDLASERLSELGEIKPGVLSAQAKHEESPEAGGEEETGKQSRGAFLHTPWPNFSQRRDDEWTGEQPVVGVRRIVNKGRY